MTSAFFADASAASDALKTSISPLFSTLSAVAIVAAVLFVALGGYQYITSAGEPSKLERAKKTLRNAIIGLVIVLGASGLVSIMQNAYNVKPVQTPQLHEVQTGQDSTGGVSDVTNAAISGFIQSAIQSVGQPVVDGLKQFTKATPLMAENSAVFNVWVVVVAIVDVLFLLVVALIGFRVMSASALGMEEVDLRSLVPQVILTFIVTNLSIFVIDAIITVSNAMIHALLIGMSNDIIWATLGTLITGGVGSISIGVLLLLAVICIFGIALMIYYLIRLVTLYVGAVLSPLIVLLWLLPSFRDFAIAATKAYVITIFVLFVHAVILMLAVSLFAGVVKGGSSGTDGFMACLLGIATLLALLKTSSVMNHMMLASAGAGSLRRLGTTFVRSTSHITKSVKTARSGTNVADKASSVKSVQTVNKMTNSPTRILANSSNFGRGTAAQNLHKPQQVTIENAARELTVKKPKSYQAIVTAGTESGKLTLTKARAKRGIKE